MPPTDFIEGFSLEEWSEISIGDWSDGADFDVNRNT